MHPSVTKYTTLRMIIGIFVPTISSIQMYFQFGIPHDKMLRGKGYQKTMWLQVRGYYCQKNQDQKDVILNDYFCKLGRNFFLQYFPKKQVSVRLEEQFKIDHLPDTHKAEFSTQFKNYKKRNVNDIQSKIV